MQKASHDIPSWMNHKVESRLSGEISTTSDMQTVYNGTIMAESKQELSSHLMRVKEKSKKPGLKLNIQKKIKKKNLNIQKTKIMATGPITSWQIEGEKLEVVTDFIFLGFEITADETKRHLLLERRVMTNLDNILKSKDITLPTKVCIVKAMVFPIVMHQCESWTIKKAEN